MKSLENKRIGRIGRTSSAHKEVRRKSCILGLYEVPDEVFPFAVQQVCRRNFDEGIASRLLAHSGTGGRNHDLCCQCRVVDVHVEFKQLILRFAGIHLCG